MKITRDDFNRLGVLLSKETKILAFLEGNRDYAVSLDEIVEKVSGLNIDRLRSPNVTWKDIIDFLYESIEIITALDRLVYEGKVEAREMKTEDGSVIFYAYNIDFEEDRT